MVFVIEKTPGSTSTSGGILEQFHCLWGSEQVFEKLHDPHKTMQKLPMPGGAPQSYVPHQKNCFTTEGGKGSESARKTLLKPDWA